MKDAIENVSAALYTLWDVHSGDMTHLQQHELTEIVNLWKTGTLITREPPITTENNGEDEQ